MTWAKDGETFELEDVEIIRDSGKAVLVSCDSLDEDTWIPKSVIHEDSEVWEGSDEGKGPGTLIIKRWFAEKEGWE